MTNEQKQLLLKDLCARLPYGVIINYFNVPQKSNVDAEVIGYSNGFIDIDNHSLNPEFIKPYLRPMSSMTEKEEEEFKQVIELELKHLESEEPGHTIISAASSTFEIDFYNKHHLDYRGLIPMGLALEAPEGMYKTE